MKIANAVAVFSVVIGALTLIISLVYVLKNNRKHFSKSLKETAATKK